ncbi:MAG: hypothetical protein ACREE7_15780 [Dongiaceae bacterium]
MGLTHVRATVCNPVDPQRSFEDAFLVDTGSRDVGRALLKLAGKEVVVPFVLGEDRDATVVGVVALEALALGVDPASGQLRPVTLLAVSALAPRP